MTNQSTNTTPDSGANNQLTVNEQLDKILLDFACDVEDANKLGDDAIRHLNIKLREAKTKLQRLMVEARISDLSDLARNCNYASGAKKVDYVPVWRIESKIEVLTKELER